MIKTKFYMERKDGVKLYRTYSDRKQPSSTNPYMKGDKVKHLDKIWISDIDNNVWEPSVYGWSEVEPNV